MGCCCTSPLCEQIGYSHHGMFRFPKNPTDVATAARVLGIPASDRQMIVDSPRNYKIAPWHIHSRHRVRDDQGMWRLRKEKDMIYRDADGVTFPFAPPNANIQHFIDAEIPSYRLCHGEQNDMLPVWVRVLAHQQVEAAGPDAAQLVAAGPGPARSVSQ